MLGPAANHRVITAAGEEYEEDEDLDTNLELARAYVEINDTESAEEILKDVHDAYGDEASKNSKFDHLKKIIDSSK